MDLKHGPMKRSWNCTKNEKMVQQNKIETKILQLKIKWSKNSKCLKKFVTKINHYWVPVHLKRILIAPQQHTDLVIDRGNSQWSTIWPTHRLGHRLCN